MRRKLATITVLILACVVIGCSSQTAPTAAGQTLGREHAQLPDTGAAPVGGIGEPEAAVDIANIPAPLVVVGQPAPPPSPGPR